MARRTPRTAKAGAEGSGEGRGEGPGEMRGEGRGEGRAGGTGSGEVGGGRGGRGGTGTGTGRAADGGTKRGASRLGPGDDAQDTAANGLAGAVRRAPVRTAAVALALVAAVAAAWTGWGWYGAAHDGDAAFARTRDAVLAAGEQAVQNLNTLDHSDLDHGLDVWESSTTGDLHTQLAQGRADFIKQVQQAQTDSTAAVLSGAVTELDTRSGRASVMIALRITVTAPKGSPSVKESRLVGELTRTASGWKLSALGQAPMGDGSATPSGQAANPSASASASPSAGAASAGSRTPGAGHPSATATH